jgi:hypothetical protein
MDGRDKPGHDGSVSGTVPALRSGMKNAAPRPGHEASADMHFFTTSRGFRFTPADPK